MAKKRMPLEAKVEIEKEILLLIEEQFDNPIEAIKFLLQFYSTFDVVIIRDILKAGNGAH